MIIAHSSLRAALLSLLLLSSSVPLPAAAAIGRVAPIAQVSASAGVGAAGAARMAPVTFSPASLRLPAPSVGIGLKASPLAVSGPALDAGAAVAPAAEAASAPRITVAAPAAAARVLAAPADAPGKLTVIGGVETAFTRLQGAKENGPAAPAAVLDQLFEGFERKGAANDAPAPVGRGTEGRGARLAPATVRAAAPANGPRWVLTEEKSAAPKTTWKRTAAVGYLAAVVPLVVTMVIVIGSQLLGHELTPNYSSPAEGISEVPSLVQAGALFVSAAVMAPIAEEIVFRAGLQGGLAKITKFLRMGSFIVPATLVSLLFVAIHETADPVLFTTRFIHAMVLAYAFKKEGLLASIAAHGFFNGLLTLPILLSAVVGLLGPDAMVAGLLSFGLMASMGVAAMIFAVKAARYLYAQRGDAKSGAIAPKPFTALHGVISLLVMAAGYFLLSPNIFWLAGIAGIAPWLLYKLYRSVKR